MNHRVRGAAHVSVMWVIFLFVLLLACGATIWVFANERATFITQKEDAEAQVVSVSERNTALNIQMAELSKAVGFRNPSDAGSLSQPAQILETVTRMKEENSFIGSDALTVEDVVGAFNSEISSLESRLQSETTAREAAEQARADADSAKTQQQADSQSAIAQLNSDLTTQREELNSSLSKADDRANDLDGRLQDAEARERSAQDQMQEAVADLNKEVKGRENTITELRKKLEVFRNPEEPDGEIIAASPDLGICYIDLGRKDMLRRGTRFDVFRTGKGGKRLPTGIVEVRALYDDRAECGIIESFNDYEPVAPGDQIMAPLYDKDLVREFVLVGRFPAGYSKELVSERLKALGAAVADEVTPTTDFLVVGDKEFVTDPDSDETGEVSETEEFRLASQYKVQLLPVRELLDLLKYD